MNINLANIDFCPGGKSATLTETTAEILLTETEKVIAPPTGTDGFNKVTITHAPVEESVSATITENGTHTITPSAGFGAMFGVNVDVNVPSFDGVMQYFYKKPTADDAGLKEMGWTDDDVNYFKYNNCAYPWEADNYTVYDVNKEIVINNESEIANYKDELYFRFCPKFDTSNETGMNNIFQDCSSLIAIPQLDSSNVTSMMYMFRNCKSLITIPQLDTSKVTNMTSMFENCLFLTSIPQLDTHSVTNMYYMFIGCTSLTSIPQLDTSKVQNTTNMFSGCISLTSVPRLDATSLTSAKNMFGTSYGALKKLTTFGGLTGLKIDFDLSSCPNLTYESLLNVFNELADVTASPKTLTLGKENLNKLWNSDKAIATNKGWVLK